MGSGGNTGDTLTFPLDEQEARWELCMYRFLLQFMMKYVILIKRWKKILMNIHVPNPTSQTTV